MSKISIASAKKLVAVTMAVLTLSTFMPATQAFQVSPQIVNAYTSPANGAFDPSQGALNFYYDLINGPANVKAEVYDCNVNCQVPIHTIFNSTLQQTSSGNHYTWAGKVNGQLVAAKSYTIRITASYNGFVDSKDLQATVIYSNPPPPQDNTPPVLSLIIPVPNPSLTQTPSFTFSSTEAGTITYFGSCGNGNKSAAVAGSNTVTLGPLVTGTTYSGCSLTVRDAANNTSQPLVLNQFTIQAQLPPPPLDTFAPVLALVTPVPNPSLTQTPSFTFSSSELGTISYFGGCSSNQTSAMAGNNTITLNSLAFGTYSNCYVTVRDPSNNTSAPLYLNTFTVQQGGGGGGDTTPPTVTITVQIPSPTTSHTPSFTFTSSEAGTLIMGGGCSTSYTNVNAGSNTVTLNYLANGTYSNCYIQVKDAAGNTSSFVYLPAFVINDQVTPPTGQVPVVSNVYASPNPFNPGTQSTTVYYTINTGSYVTVQILQGSDVVRTLADYIYQSNSGTYTYSWDGRDRYGSLLGNATYTIKVTAQNVYGTDSETGSVTISTTGGGGTNYGTLISNLNVTNATFNPRNNERATLCFTILKDYTNITVDIIPYTNYHTSSNYYSNNVVRTLVDNQSLNTNNNYCISWDGRDRYSNYVGDDVFQFRVKADRSGVYETAFAYTEVDTDGILYGFPGSTGGSGNFCGGFTDVPANNPYCKAIQYLKLKGIFSGYPDGTFRPYQPINRAETTKVILLALGISNINYAQTNYTNTNYVNTNYGYNYNNANYINSYYPYNTNNPFWDTDPNAWYMPYLRTAFQLGIIRGYPDGSFRPSQTVNRVELLKIFLESTGINIPQCNVGPYIDTPLNSDTRWYMNYVCFAADNGLMSDDGTGRFSPAAPMTRGDVANLFYQFYVRGMYNKINLTKYNNVLSGPYNDQFYYTKYTY